MNSSINEAIALARKAAKGAGYSWSMADEVAFAVAWLCRQGVDGTEHLATHLAIMDSHGVDSVKLTSLNTPWQGDDNGLCSVSAGVALSDIANELAPCSGEKEISGELLDVITPALLIPFLAYASQQVVKNRALQPNTAPELACLTHVNCPLFNVIIGSNQFSSWLSAWVPVSNPTPGSTNTRYRISVCTARDLETMPPALHHRVNVKIHTLAALNQLAARTYAPATEASRDGAGAGTLDND